MKYLKTIFIILFSISLMLSCKKKEEAPKEDPPASTSTTTGGNPAMNWTIVPSSFTTALTNIKFYNNKYGIIIGNDTTVLKTINGGQTWQKIGIPTINTDPRGCYMIDSLNILVSYYSGILKTSDGGLNWTTLNTFTLNGSPYGDFYFMNSLTGFIATGNGIAKTIDGGSTWNLISGSPISVSKVNFTSPLVGWASGSNNGVYRTTDGGNTWTNTNVGFTYYASTFFLDNTTAWAATSLSGSETIKKTTDGGATWTTVFPTAYLPDGLSAMWFFDSNKGVQARFLSTIKNTSDGGATWTLASSPLTNQKINSFYFTSANSGWAVGTNGIILKYNQ